MTEEEHIKTGKQKLVNMYRKRLKSAPWTNARKLMDYGALEDEDIEVIRKKLGFYKARNLLMSLGIDVDHTHGYDDGEWLEPRPPYQE